MTSIVRRTGISRAVVAALALITAVPLTAGQAQAAPEPVDSVRATVQRNADNVKVELLSGSLAVDGADLVVRNQAGAVLTKVPLQVRGPKDEVYPLAATVSGRTATLTPPPAARPPSRSSAPGSNGESSVPRPDPNATTWRCSSSTRI